MSVSDHTGLASSRPCGAAQLSARSSDLVPLSDRPIPPPAVRSARERHIRGRRAPHPRSGRHRAAVLPSAVLPAYGAVPPTVPMATCSHFMTHLFAPTLTGQPFIVPLLTLPPPRAAAVPSGRHGPIRHRNSLPLNGHCALPVMSQSAVCLPSAERAMAGRAATRGGCAPAAPAHPGHARPRDTTANLPRVAVTRAGSLVFRSAARAGPCSDLARGQQVGRRGHRCRHAAPVVSRRGAQHGPETDPVRLRRAAVPPAAEVVPWRRAAPTTHAADSSQLSIRDGSDSVRPLQDRCRRRRGGEQ